LYQDSELFLEHSFRIWQNGDHQWILVISWNLETMSTQEEIREDIRRLKVREQTEGTSSALDNRIASENNKLTALIQSQQQGNFSSSHLIFPLSFPNPLDVTHCPITLDISSSPILVMVNTEGKSKLMDLIVVWLFNVRGKEFFEPIILLTSFVLSLVVFTLTANHRQSSY